MLHKKRALAAALAAGALGATALTGTVANAAPAEVNAPRVGGCVGKAFAGTLGPGKAICNGNYLVRMQTNGDLVLRVISTGMACWTSGTNRAPGGDTSAVFVGNKFGAPWVDIESESQGRLTRIVGAHTYLHFGTNANVNTRGEFWIGYKKIAGC
ncbi:hypothetical protein [Streptomyces flaveus]|uniref:hypothetical protein n=1 Tax=Streptomyces flaveus TaxID=66370 RepID=UPI0033198023